MLRSLLLIPVLTAALGAQATYAAGQRDVGWPNLTGQGTTTLISRIHYPATTAGTDTPFLTRAGGWPTVVFLHGYATPGPFYGTLGAAFAEAGFIAVVVLLDVIIGAVQEWRAEQSAASLRHFERATAVARQADDLFEIAAAQTGVCFLRTLVGDREGAVEAGEEVMGRLPG